MKNVLKLFIVTGFLFTSIASFANEPESMVQPDAVESEFAEDSEFYYDFDDIEGEDEYYDDTDENWDENWDAEWDTEWDSESEDIEASDMPDVENLNNY